MRLKRNAAENLSRKRGGQFKKAFQRRKAGSQEKQVGALKAIKAKRHPGKLEKLAQPVPQDFFNRPFENNP